MDRQSVLYESDGRIATITLNRPENRNSMTPDVMQGFREAVAIERTKVDRSHRSPRGTSVGCAVRVVMTTERESQ